MEHPELQELKLKCKEGSHLTMCVCMCVCVINSCKNKQTMLCCIYVCVYVYV